MWLLRKLLVGRSAAMNRFQRRKSPGPRAKKILQQALKNGSPLENQRHRFEHSSRLGSALKELDQRVSMRLRYRRARRHIAGLRTHLASPAAAWRAFSPVTPLAQLRVPSVAPLDAFASSRALHNLKLAVRNHARGCTVTTLKTSFSGVRLRSRPSKPPTPCQLRMPREFATFLMSNCTSRLRVTLY